MSNERRQRQKAEGRARREAERKAAARKELIRRIGVALGLGLIVAVILFGTGALSRRDTSAELAAGYQAFRERPTACEADAPPPLVPAQFTQPATEDLSETIATVNTSCGDLIIKLNPAGFPATVNSFVFLARSGFYDGTVFHRIAPGFVIQGGDQDGSGRGGPGYRIPDEFPDDAFTYSRGVVAMANAGTGTTGSQFFIVIADDSRLGPQFNVLGTLIGGFETLDRIAATPTGRQPNSVEASLPLESVYIESISFGN